VDDVVNSRQQDVHRADASGDADTRARAQTHAERAGGARHRVAAARHDPESRRHDLHCVRQVQAQQAVSAVLHLVNALLA
jgi:hypothetical protein